MQICIPTSVRASQKNTGRFYLTWQSASSRYYLQNPLDNIFLAAGGLDEAWADDANFSTGAFVGLWNDLLYAKKNYNIDVVILDLGAGTHRHTIDFFSSCHMGITVVLPEPTSIENAYSFLKATIWKIVDNAGIQLEQNTAADEIKNYLLSHDDSLKLGSPVKKIEKFADQYPQLVEYIFTAIHGKNIGFIVNQIRSQKDIDISVSMETICRQYFGFDTCSLGYMNYDDAAWKSLRNRRLLFMDFPHSLLNRRVNEITRKTLEKMGFQGGPRWTRK